LGLCECLDVRAVGIAVDNLAESELLVQVDLHLTVVS
jgi:hypothetical protein